MSKITKEQITQWIEDLRSGNYRKCTGVLKMIGVDNDCSYCALGVLALQLQDQYMIEVNKSSISAELVERNGTPVGYRPFDELLGGFEETQSIYRLSDGSATFDAVIQYLENKLNG
jgi:hypothetical protein